MKNTILFEVMESQKAAERFKGYVNHGAFWKGGAESGYTRLNRNGTSRVTADMAIDLNIV